ncbi:MAG: ABC transporter, permease protein (cluster 3, basic aa/glutamine/opines), partial [uncultured Craurococcus sp.]
ERHHPQRRAEGRRGGAAHRADQPDRLRRLDASQPVLGLALDRGHPGARLFHHPLGHRLRRLGLRQRGLVGAEQPDPGLPRPARRRRLLGGDHGEAPLHPLRHLSLRGALAAGALRRPLRRALRRLRHAAVLAEGAGADLGRHPRRHRRADVGRRAGDALCAAGALGRPRHHPDPGDLRPGLRLPARHPRGARAAVEAAGDQGDLRDLCRADPRRAADLAALHGERDVPAFPPRGDEHRQAAARPDRHHPLRRRLPRRGGARRAAIPLEGSVRGGRCARPLLLAEDRLHHPAAGAAPGDPAAGEHLHRLLQGHLAGADHRHLRPADGGQDGDHRAGLAGLRHRGLPDRRRDLLHLLLRHEQVQPGPGGGAQPPPRAL